MKAERWSSRSRGVCYRDSNGVPFVFKGSMKGFVRLCAVLYGFRNTMQEYSDVFLILFYHKSVKPWPTCCVGVHVHNPLDRNIIVETSVPLKKWPRGVHKGGVRPGLKGFRVSGLKVEGCESGRLPATQAACCFWTGERSNSKGLRVLSLRTLE